MDWKLSAGTGCLSVVCFVASFRFWLIDFGCCWCCCCGGFQMGNEIGSCLDAGGIFQGSPKLFFSFPSAFHFSAWKKKETLHFVIPDEWWQWPVEQPVKNNQWTIVCLYFWNDGSGEWGTAVAAAQLQPPGRLFQQRLFQQRAPETGG